jgi:hypothetical protein
MVVNAECELAVYASVEAGHSPLFPLSHPIPNWQGGGEASAVLVGGDSEQTGKAECSDHEEWILERLGGPTERTAWCEVPRQSFMCFIHPCRRARYW